MKVWVQRYRRALLFSGFAVAVVGSAVAWRTWDYIQNDPDFCTSCHVMDDAHGRWGRSGHKDINCHTCHPGDIKSNLHQLWVQVTQRPTEVKKHAVVPAKICGSCHLSDDARWKQVAATPGHRIHWGDHRIECVTCHAPAVHEFIPNDEMCAKCHANQMVALDAMAKNHCTSCHNFLVGTGKTLLPGAEQCGECHASETGQGPQLAPEWHPQIDCATCHPVHDPVSPALDRPDRDGRALPCADCHDDVEASGPPAHDECSSCHVPHARPDAEQGCRGCHEAIADVLPQRQHHACADCHEPHDVTIPAAERCDECHRDRESMRTATRITAHQRCESCHTPHEAAPPDAPVCAQCHKKEARAAGAASVAAHTRCTSCHAVHSPEQPRACGSCHGEQQAAARTAPKAHQDCVQCHRAHGEPRASVNSCLACHTKEALAARGGPPEHARCATCHDPHRPAVPTQATCNECHGRIRTAVDAEPKAHQDCITCHGWHQKSLAVPDTRCTNCHREQAAARKSAHRDCATCHRPHDNLPPVGCADCHQAVVAGVRSARGDHARCASCHGEVHGTAPAGNASCARCHEADARAGLHAVPQHGKCDDCHQAHPPRPPAAAVCTSCHPPASIRRHPPAAQGVTACQGCHNFRRRLP